MKAGPGRHRRAIRHGIGRIDELDHTCGQRSHLSADGDDGARRCGGWQRQADQAARRGCESDLDGPVQRCLIARNQALALNAPAPGLREAAQGAGQVRRAGRALQRASLGQGHQDVAGL